MLGIGLFFLSLLLTVILYQVSGLMAVVFLVLATVCIPGFMIHRREVAYAPEMTEESQGLRYGWLRLAHILSVDATGIAIGVLLFLVAALALHVLQVNGALH